MFDPSARATITGLADGRYSLRGLIDEGGMARVYRARDNRLDVDRAIKLLNPELEVRAGVRRRFEAEARTMARLHHPNIVTVHDVGTEGPFVYIVMELAEGGNLRERVRNLGPLPPRLASTVVVGVLDALQLAHAQGVVHRDVKPHNVLITKDGVPKVTDFGIAHVEQPDRQLTRTGAILGTWAYMAPEQRTDARAADARADVYAVGATLYFLVTGKEPNDLYVAEDIEQRLAEIPAPLATLIRRATRYKPEDRYVSATAMLAALREVLPDLPADPPGTPPLPLPLPEPGAVDTGATLAPRSTAGSTGGERVDFVVPPRAPEAHPPASATAAIDFEPSEVVPAPAAPPARRRWIGFGVFLLLVVGAAVLLGFPADEPAKPLTARPAPPAPTSGASASTPADALAPPDPVPPPADAPPAVVPSAEPPPHAATVPTPSAPTPTAVSTRSSGQPTPIPTPAPPTDPAPVSGMLYVMSRPWSQVTVDGAPRGKTGWSGKLPVGAHALRLEAQDGRAHAETVEVSADADRRICWDFDAEAACSR